jgi:hypothetical protein
MKLSHGHQPAYPSFLRFVPSANRVKCLFYNKAIHYKGISETTKDPADCRNDNQRGLLNFFLGDYSADLQHNLSLHSL